MLDWESLYNYEYDIEHIFKETVLIFYYMYLLWEEEYFMNKYWVVPYILFSCCYLGKCPLAISKFYQNYV